VNSDFLVSANTECSDCVACLPLVSVQITWSRKSSQACYSRNTSCYTRDVCNQRIVPKEAVQQFMPGNGHTFE
jgi:hypothetical protein